MKKPKIILLFLMVLTCWVGCHKDKEIDVKEAVVSNVEVTVSGNQARFSWQVDFAGAFHTGVELSQNENMTDLRRVEATEEEDKFVAVVDSLSEGKKYYYRIVIWNKFSSFEDELKDFTTSKTFSVHVSAEPPTGGTATGGGTFAEGDTCMVVAKANVGYNFVNWTENGSQVSAEAEYSFAVTNNRNLVANFTSQEYTITATVEPEVGGTVSGSGGYNSGDECTLTATANEGYEFMNWTKDGTVVSTNPVYTFTVNETATFVAHFQIKSYTITVEANPSNGGTVDGGGIYEYGQTCTAHASENEGYHFVNWTENGGQVSSSMEYTFTVTGDRNLVANFSAEDYIISVEIEPENGGTVTGAGGYNYGDECTLKATANAGYDFVNWTKDDGTVISTDAVYSFTVTESASYVAHFQIRSYTITVSANPNNSGTVYVGNTQGTTQGTFNSGQYCTVHANSTSDYQFINWTENDSVVSTYATYSFIVNSDRELVANFTRVYTISVSANPTNGGTVTGGGKYQQGQYCTVTATNNPNYAFVNWMEGSQVVSTQAEYTFMVERDRTLVAHFEPQLGDYTISVSANPSSGGSAHVGSPTGPTTGTYSSGQQCTVYAVANSNYTFTNWTEGSTVVSTQANYTFTVNSNRTLVANFNANPSWPNGVLPGYFSVSTTQQVQFSQGNLQYIGSASTPYWKFADNQWVVLGTTTGQNSTSQTADRDLFGWGTSGWSGSGATYYLPWDTDNSDGSLYGPPDSYNLTDIYANADWGVYNQISNGGDQVGLWRTLTKYEWVWVLGPSNPNPGTNCRTSSTVNGTPNARFAKATVNDVSGVVVFPDSYTHPSGADAPKYINVSDAYFSSNSWSDAAWTAMEDAGCVFLPATGYRRGALVNDVGSNGYYWSASYRSSIYAYYVNFGGSSLGPQFSSIRCSGHSVRLVRSAQ